MDSNLIEKAHSLLEDYSEYGPLDWEQSPGLECIDPLDYWLVMEELRAAAEV